jgi:uncharacterized protein (TIGR02996 family)
MCDETRQSLLRAVLAAPADDAPRLLYAEWLEENGDAWDVQYAELIRLEVWLAHADTRQTAGGWSAADEAEYNRRLNQVEELRWNRKKRWGLDAARGDIDRGFVRAIDLGLDTFLDRAEAVFRRHPITTVRFWPVPDLGGEPYLVAVVTADWRQDVWPRVRPERWPLELFPGEAGREYRFRTYAEALAVLSAAAVAYGRRRAELPDLVGEAP